MPDVLPGVTRQKTTNEIPVEFNRPGHPDHSRMGSPSVRVDRTNSSWPLRPLGSVPTILRRISICPYFLP